jgi:hypothetical protein
MFFDFFLLNELFTGFPLMVLIINFLLLFLGEGNSFTGEKGSLFVTAGCIIDLLRTEKMKEKKKKRRKGFLIEIYLEQESLQLNLIWFFHFFASFWNS